MTTNEELAAEHGIRLLTIKTSDGTETTIPLPQDGSWGAYVGETPIVGVAGEHDPNDREKLVIGHWPDGEEWHGLADAPAVVQPDHGPFPAGCERVRTCRTNAHRAIWSGKLAALKVAVDAYNEEALGRRRSAIVDLDLLTAVETKLGDLLPSDVTPIDVATDLILLGADPTPGSTEHWWESFSGEVDDLLDQHGHSPEAYEAALPDETN